MRIAVWHNLPSASGKRGLLPRLGNRRARASSRAWCPLSANQTYPPLGALLREHITPMDWRPSSRRPLWSRLLDPAVDDISGG